MIKIFKGVLVIRLWRWNHFQMELCIFPPCKKIEAHKHDQEDIELLHLWGSGSCYYRYLTPNDYRSTKTTVWDTIRFYTIPAGYWHGADVGPFGLITISCQTWKTKPSSVVEDYKEATIYLTY